MTTAVCGHIAAVVDPRDRWRAFLAQRLELAWRGVADQNPGHDQTVTDSHPSLRNNSYQPCETSLVQPTHSWRRGLSVSVWGSASEMSVRRRQWPYDRLEPRR
jgi:hypothetical protein